MAERQNFTDQFKTKVALEALCGDMDALEVAKTYQVELNQVSSWAIEEFADRVGVEATRLDSARYLSGLHALVRDVGDTFTQSLVLRLVARTEGYSKAGFSALCSLYSYWPGHMRSLSLPRCFVEVGATKIAWYAAIRERYPEETASDVFGQNLRNLTKVDLSYAGLELVFSVEVVDWIDRKWMNWGDVVLLDCLTEVAGRPGV